MSKLLIPLALLTLTIQAAAANEGDIWACSAEVPPTLYPTVTIYRAKDGWITDTTLVEALRKQGWTEEFIDERTRARVIEDTSDALVAIRPIIETKNNQTQVSLHAILINKHNLQYRSTFIAVPPNLEDKFLSNDETSKGTCRLV